MLRFPGPLGSMGHEPVLPPDPIEEGGQSVEGSAIAAAAARYVGARSLVVNGQRFRWDCSGFVEAAMATVGCDYTGSSAMLFEQARDAGVLHRRRIPTPGDVAFFDNTYDRNNDGQLNDPLSHVAIVEAVDQDGTITLIHLSSKGIVRIRMNLREPDVYKTEAGELRNDYLRSKREGDSPRTRYLSGELWTGFASFWKLEQDGAADSD